MQTETSSIDPHYAVVGANQVVAEQIFESLLRTDEAMRPAPGLAASWTRTADETWEFRLRPAARFHDGSPVTAEDVRFSLERMPNVPGSPAPNTRLAGVTRAIELVGPEILRIHTRAPEAALPLHALGAYVVSARAAAGAGTADFNSGRAAIGSGPWRFIEWRPGERLVLERVRPDLPFARAIIRPIGADAARLAALLAGDVDLIDSVPPGDLERLRGDARVRLWTAPSARLIYLALDQQEPPVQLRAMDGSALATNPLRDPRVRRALSAAINRPLIVERILHGAGHATGQMAPEGFTGYDPAIAPPAYDPAAAKRLLAEAGWSQGFRLTLTSPNNRYVEDDKTAQAVAQMWTRAGLPTQVDVLPSNSFFAHAARREFAAFLIGFGHTAADSFTGLSQVLNSYDPGRGLGALNRMRFSSPALDAALARSAAAGDPETRAAALREATRIGFAEEAAILPLHFPDNAWATGAGFTYRPSMREGALAEYLRPAR